MVGEVSGSAAPERGVSCILTVGGLAKETGGAAVVVSELCRALTELGATVELISTGTGPAAIPPSFKTPRTWRLTEVRGFAWPAARVKWAPGFRGAVRRRCEAAGEVVLHDHGLWLPSNHSVAKVARTLGIPLVISPLGMLFPWTRRHKPFKKRVAWGLYQRRDLQSASALHATSWQEFEALRALGLRQPVAVVPNAFELPPEDLRSPRSNDPRIALFLSRLTPKKGLDSLLRVWRALRPQGWRLVIAGPDEGGYGARLLKQWQVEGQDSAVECIGPVWGQEKWRLIRTASVFVLPSRSENFGVVIAEALASGVPVITTKETPWQEIEHHRCGWWIDGGDEALSVALGEAITLSGAELDQMGARGKVLIEQEFSSITMARRMIAVYAWLLGRGPQPEGVVVD
ncbi:MAG: glycosyltransferase [Acidobacteria bacterium]|nr:MAG: glycosyltransferase [Acidobacteriota bacterium]